MSNPTIKTMYTEQHTVRIIALQVVLLAILILYTHSYWLAIALAADFALRAFTTIPAPLALTVKAVRKWIHWEHKPVFAAPKKFAASMGFFFSLAIAVLFFLHLSIAAYTVGAVLLACACLESFFNICVGCYVYDWVVAPFKK